MNEQYNTIIGSDEALKGDTFGGIVVVGAFFNKDEEEQLREMGVRDSKKITDIVIIGIAQRLLKTFPDRFAIKDISIEEYNKLFTSFGGMTPLLNSLHGGVGEELKHKLGEALFVVDEYPGCSVGDERLTQAESQYEAVAAASIVARYYGLKQFDRLSEKAGFRIPKGSTHVKEAVETLLCKGEPLTHYCKLHFKNVQKLMSDQKQSKLHCSYE